VADTFEDGVRAEPKSALERRMLLAAEIAFMVAATGFFLYLLNYYFSGRGGPSLLAITAVPMTICVVVLNDLRKGALYPRLGIIAPTVIAVAICLFCAYAVWYLRTEFEQIRVFRLGIWNNHDRAVGGILTLLVLEYARRHYFALFVVSAFLVVYTGYGYLVPGMFNHPGMSWRRVISSTSLEMTTGIFEQLAQLGLTLIGSFILVLAALRAFGCIDSILVGSTRIAVRSPRLLPQAAVIGSIGVAAVSGSGAANAATTGSATIPVLIKAGFPRTTAAAVETASSLGGQLMPPLMGIAAFLMADYLRVSYFDVVARGFVPAIIYFIGVAFAVYLLAARFQRGSIKVEAAPLLAMDKVNILAYAIAVGGLIWLMGVERRPPLTSARNVFLALMIFLGAAFIIRSLVNRVRDPRELLKPFYRLVETFATITADLVILLATLGILTATFTITGVPTKVGVLMMQGAGVNLAMMVLIAFAFGYLVGMGLPVAPTYIITAVVIAPSMIQAGVDPWVVHFFAFFIACFGELSPPTSVTAAVTARIADAPFVRTMMQAMLLCMPLMVMMGAIFVRPDLVVTPGLEQVPAFLLVLIGTLALSFAIQGRYVDARPMDFLFRGLLGAAAFALLLYPGNDWPAILLATGIVAAIGAGLWSMRSRDIDKPEAAEITVKAS
jgi:TRAP transporter 4TM/12TM fusion protein